MGYRVNCEGRANRDERLLPAKKRTTARAKTALCS